MNREISVRYPPHDYQFPSWHFQTKEHSARPSKSSSSSSLFDVLIQTLEKEVMCGCIHAHILINFPQIIYSQLCNAIMSKNTSTSLKNAYSCPPDQSSLLLTPPGIVVVSICVECRGVSRVRGKGKMSQSTKSP